MQRCYTTNKRQSSQSYGFSSSHVRMWELDYKESWAPKNWCSWTVVWRGLLRVPWTARRSNQSILKEISPGCSLEGLMLKLKLQYFNHLMWLKPSSGYPSQWGFSCPYSSLCQELGQWKLWAPVRYLANFPADYEGDSLVFFPTAFSSFLSALSPGTQARPKPRMPGSGWSYCKNSVRDKAISGSWIC